MSWSKRIELCNHGHRSLPACQRHPAKFLSLVFGVESGLARRNMYVACQDFTIGNLAPQWSHIEEGELEFANILRISCKMVPGWWSMSVTLYAHCMFRSTCDNSSYTWGKDAAGFQEGFLSLQFGIPRNTTWAYFRIADGHDRVNDSNTHIVRVIFESYDMCRCALMNYWPYWCIYTYNKRLEEYNNHTHNDGMMTRTIMAREMIFNFSTVSVVCIASYRLGRCQKLTPWSFRCPVDL